MLFSLERFLHGTGKGPMPLEYLRRAANKKYPLMAPKTWKDRLIGKRVDRSCLTPDWEQRTGASEKTTISCGFPSERRMWTRVLVRVELDSSGCIVSIRARCISFSPEGTARN